MTSSPTASPQQLNHLTLIVLLALLLFFPLSLSLDDFFPFLFLLTTLCNFSQHRVNCQHLFWSIFIFFFCLSFLRTFRGFYFGSPAATFATVLIRFQKHPSRQAHKTITFPTKQQHRDDLTFARAFAQTKMSINSFQRVCSAMLHTLLRVLLASPH